MIWTHTLNGLAVVFLLLLVYLFMMGLDGKILAFLAASVCLLFANIHRIKTFKASATGVEAETREVIKEAKDTIEELRFIAKDFSHLFITFLHGEGRFGGAMGDEEKQAFEDKLLQNLREIGLNENEIEGVRKAQRPYVLFDYVSFITRKLHDRVSGDKRAQWNEFFSADRRKGIGYEPSPDELQEFLSSIDVMTDEIREHIEDYRHYQQHTKHRRPEGWKRRTEWNTPRE